MRHAFIVCALLIHGRCLFAQEGAADSSKVIPLKEVTVTATRSPIPVEDAPSHVILLTSDDIRNSNGSTLSDLLSQATNVFLRENGGGGSISTISMRGGASEHVLMLLNGMRYNSFQNGLADLNLLPLQNIERVEAISGGSSALYGADALSGVVNVITRKPNGDFHLRAAGGSGSFERSHIALEGSSAIGGIGIMAGYGMERGRDDYAFSTPVSPDSTLHREDADFVRQQLYLQGFGGIDEHTSLNVAIQDVRADRGSPGPYSPVTPADARLFDNIITSSAELSHSGGSEVSWNVATSYQYNYETFSDPDPLYPYNTFYKNRTFTLNPQMGWQFAKSQLLNVGLDATQGSLESPDFDSSITRTQTAGYATLTSAFSSDGTTLNRISIYVAMRYDHISDVGGAFTPKAGVNIRLLNEGNIRFRSSVARNFRPPSFNDLYYRYFGNPDLKPEHSTSVDASLSGESRLLGLHSLEAGYFLINTEDRILFDPVAFIPENIGKVRSSGFELHYAYAMFEGSPTIGLNYSFTDAQKMNSDSTNDPTYGKQLVYTPKNTLNASLSASRGDWSASFSYSLVGERYTTADNTQSLPEYHLMNVNIRYAPVIASLKWALKGEIDNCFNTSYEVFRNYPMPGRGYRITLGVEY